MKIKFNDILEKLPKEDVNDYRSENKVLFSNSRRVCVVIDDDPTGNQTVYGIPLLTSWKLNVFIKEFIQGTPIFFVLTNSRSLMPDEVAVIYKEIGDNIAKASQITKRGVSIISRSDSTLRGHFPLEPNTLREYLKLKDPITVFIPVMFEGKRLTVNNVHYIHDTDELIPVNETPFAQDHSFKYTKANLAEYIEEKTLGRVPSESVISFSLEKIRNTKVDELVTEVKKIPAQSYCIFNSINYTDLDKVAQVLLYAEKLGKQIIYRTSSSFVPSYIGQEPKELLSASEILDKSNRNGGITVVGSYVKKSSEQLHKALSLFDASSIVEIEVSKVLKNGSNDYMEKIIERINKLLYNEKDVIVFTSRTLVTGSNINTNVDIAKTISQSLIDLVVGLTVKPKYFIAKGGITSHDLAIKGLGMLRSKVIGQIQPGIPVWKMGSETKFPRLSYIVFPGNVGDSTTLHTIITKLKTHV
ncbi:four-carbon acid sugar kinase family protein [Flavobacteriaceae bacterium MHTCC 0001]